MKNDDIVRKEFNKNFNEQTDFKVKVSFNLNIKLEEGYSRLDRAKRFIEMVFRNSLLKQPYLYTDQLAHKISSQPDQCSLQFEKNQLDKWTDIDVEFQFNDFAASNTRLFDQMLFMGGGDRTLKLMKTLAARLDYAFTALSGFQQNGIQGNEFDNQTDANDKEHLENVVRDVAMALTGREIDFK